MDAGSAYPTDVATAPQQSFDPALPVTYAAPSSSTHHPLGIVSFVAGILGILMMCCIFMCIGPGIAAVLAIVAITLGSIAIHQINANPAAYHGKGMAIAGVALGATILLIEAVFILVLVISFATAKAGP